MGRPGGGARLRSLFYPLVDVNKIKPGQIRCGEHTDYGGITLLLQDDVGGLEVCKETSLYSVTYSVVLCKSGRAVQFHPVLRLFECFPK